MEKITIIYAPKKKESFAGGSYQTRKNINETHFQLSKTVII